MEKPVEKFVPEFSNQNCVKQYQKMTIQHISDFKDTSNTDHGIVNTQNEQLVIQNQVVGNQNIEHETHTDKLDTVYIVQSLLSLALDQVDQNLDHTSQNKTQNTKAEVQNVVINDNVQTSLSKGVPARKRKRNEIEIPDNPNWDEDEFYNNGFRKHKLRDKSAKKILSPIQNLQPIKKVVKKVKKIIKKGKRNNRLPKPKKPVESITQWYKCAICITSYTTPVGLMTHIASKHTDVTYTCLLCSAVFNSNALLLKHKITHNDQGKVFRCSNCTEIFDDHCDYLIHDLDHQTETFFKCLECGKIYFRKPSMQDHIYTHFETRIKCKLCLRKLRKKYMAKHMDKHSKVKTCVECRKGFSGTLEYHMVSHTGLKLHQCYYCGKCFATSSNRDKHLKTHTKEKPFECNICFGTYAERPTLVKHMITHETEPRYHCEICDKKFREKISLINHLSIHSNTQQYPCLLCKKPLSTLQGLKNHMLYKHSTERTHHCKICDKWYKNRQAINQHNLKKSHLRNAIGAAKKMPCE